jgi:DNA-binding PucR family transcriptional regulator
MRSVESLLGAVASALEDQIDDLVEEMLARMRAEVANFADLELPEVDDATRHSAYANVRAALAGLRGDRATAAVAPIEAQDNARRAARLGVELPQLLQTYRIGHAVAWERILTQVEALDVDPDARSEILRLASRYAFGYIDAVIPTITEAYTRERDGLLRSDENRRLRTVRDVLAGVRADASELGFDLRVEHLGAVATGEGADAALRALAAELGGAALIVAVDAFTWAWFSVTGPGAERARSIASFAPPAGTLVAFGAAGSGIEGFRRTHREAQRAYLIGRRRSQAVTRFEDVVVETLALRDEPAARELVARELGPLAADDSRSATLRATLSAYFETSSNASAAAALLGVNDRTVAYRLRGIEDLLGYAVSTRSLELRIALRLAALLENEVPEP